MIRTPDQRLRVFVSSTLGELSDERGAAREGIERLRLSPVMFELGARPHPPRELYRAYLEQSHVFVGIYWERYGWVAPGEEVSGLEDEYRLSVSLPRLVYIKEPAPEREARLDELLKQIKSEDRTSYKRFSDADELADLVESDLVVLLAERFEATAGADRHHGAPLSAPPSPLTETVGRAQEVAAVAGQLQAGTRLVTLTGPGGVGKTRLALEVARRVQDSYPGGTHFVPLAAITDPELVLYAVADRLGITVGGTRGPRDAIADRVAGRATLLMLDNLEQVATAGAELVLLLESCAELQVLATSRQALRVGGEHDVPVAPLPLPDPDLPLSSLDQEPVVRLFVERARDVSPRFTLDKSNAAAVAELCRRLDGLPLAIELAAARARLLSPAALLERLDPRFYALGEGRVDLPERQRTLRATIDWSHDLLDEREQALFARLAVFVGGFSLAAAESVCQTDGEADVLETLASLLDKSLIVVVDDPIEGEPRFQMLEIVRAYAAERLGERSEAELMRRRHLDWYRRLSERAQPFLCGAGQREWAARFDPERANLRAAVQTALELGDGEAVIEIVWDVIVFYFIRDAVHEPAAWMQQVANAGRPMAAVPTAKLRSLLTLMRIHRGEYGEARESLESSLQVFRAEGMDFETAVALKELAWVQYLLDEDAATAIAALEEASRLFESIHHDWGVALAELQLGSVLTAAGDRTRAEERFQRSLDYSRRIDNWPLMAQGLQHLGMIRILAGHAEEAVPLIEKAAILLKQGRHETEATSCLDALGAIALADGDSQTAARALAVADVARRGLGVSLWPSAQAFVTQLVQGARASVGPGAFADLFEQAEKLDPFEVLDQTLNAVQPREPEAARPKPSRRSS